MNENKNNKTQIDLPPWIELKYIDLPQKHEFIFEALKTAIKAINGKIKIDKKYSIILGQSPFLLSAGDTNSVSCTLDNEVIGLTMENMIFLDCQKLQCRPHQQTVAIILEEIVHCMMNVEDENLVKKIVPLLYPEVYWDVLRGYWPTPDHNQDV